nr:uncharacterized protein LOC110077775 [Pogona vitticeps]
MGILTKWTLLQRGRFQSLDAWCQGRSGPPGAPAFVSPPSGKHRRPPWGRMSVCTFSFHSPALPPPLNLTGKFSASQSYRLFVIWFQRSETFTSLKGKSAKHLGNPGAAVRGDALDSPCHVVGRSSRQEPFHKSTRLPQTASRWFCGGNPASHALTGCPQPRFGDTQRPLPKFSQSSRRGRETGRAGRRERMSRSLSWRTDRPTPAPVWEHAAPQPPQFSQSSRRGRETGRAGRRERMSRSLSWRTDRPTPWAR